MSTETKTNHVRHQISGLVFVFLAMASAAIVSTGKLFGLEPGANQPDTEYQTLNPDGSVSINTTALTKDITGYAGPVPVEVTVNKGIITGVTPLENSETPGFFKRVTESGILDSWTGKTPEEALETHVDAISGATYSSTALIANVNAAMSEYIRQAPPQQSAPANHGLAFYAAIAVVLSGAILPLFVKNRNYRLVQQVLNTAVLGFWAGTFIDYTLILGLLSNGIGSSATVITILMLIVAFIYPLSGRNRHYCAWICPLGSLQELASRTNPKHKINIGPTATKRLKLARMVLWGALMMCLWTGWAASWIDYELFTAFMVKQAATAVIIAGSAFIILSVFINRPYCRFVCPTGCLLNLSENIESK